MGNPVPRLPPAKPADDPPDRPRLLSGLSVRLLWFTFGFVLLAEALIFPPSAAGFRTAWLMERVQAGQIAALALDASPDRMVSEELSRQLLDSAQVLAVAEKRDDERQLVLGPSMPVTGPLRLADLRSETLARQVMETFATLFAPEGRFVRILAAPMQGQGEFIEVIVPEAPLKRDLTAFSVRIAFLSLGISAFTGALVYLALFFVVVRPIRRITISVEQFRAAPRDLTRSITPSGRKDEIGRAEAALADMEAAVRQALQQRERLAGLGEAVAKIAHDLRNSLTTAQMVSDSLSLSEDPRVQRAAPRLERAIERATRLAQDALVYGRADTPRPDIQDVRLAVALRASLEDGLVQAKPVSVTLDMSDALKVRADSEHLHRIGVNLVRNAAQAMAEAGTKEPMIRVEAETAETRIAIRFADNGPGLPPKAREHLFEPFTGSVGRGGTGLGLALSRELARGMGGDLTLRESGPNGTAFELTLPLAGV
jgi:signal transduction histidine kinase